MKRISLSQDNINALVEEFRQSLVGLRSNQEKIHFEKSFKDILAIDETKVKKPVIYFSNDAWLKMNALVQSSNKELAWQATVEKRKFKNREDSDDFFYYIDQVYVYPQKVTAAFVDTDEVEYSEWSLKLPDEVFNKLRFQGHSHVNMAVNPSGTDQNTYQNFLDQLDEGDFYIFMILNKRREFTILLYDFAQDIIFETKDCYIDILTRTGSLTRWVEENKKQVIDKIEQFNKAWEYEKQGTVFKEDPIEWVTDYSYKQGGMVYRFEDDQDRADFFMKHPEHISSTVPNDRAKAIIVARKKWEQENQKNKKKPGRPPKTVRS